MDENSIEKFGHQIVQILCSHELGYGYTSLAEFKRDFRDYEGFDPEQKAREFGYDTLKELFHADAMRPYVFTEQKQQLPNMQPIMRYRGIDRSGIEEEIRIWQQCLEQRQQRHRRAIRPRMQAEQSQRGVGHNSRHAAIPIMQRNPLQNRFENNHELLTDNEEDENSRNDGNGNENCICNADNAPPVALNKIASPSGFPGRPLKNMANAIKNMAFIWQKCFKNMAFIWHPVFHLNQ